MTANASPTPAWAVGRGAREDRKRFQSDSAANRVATVFRLRQRGGSLEWLSIRGGNPFSSMSGQRKTSDRDGQRHAKETSRFHTPLVQLQHRAT
jgi:hypothetical protein